VESIEQKCSGDPTVPLSIVGLGHAVGILCLRRLSSSVWWWGGVKCP